MTPFDTVAALALCEAAGACADCGVEHSHGDGHGYAMYEAIATLRAAVAEVERLSLLAAELRAALSSLNEAPPTTSKVVWIITEGNSPDDCGDGEFGVEVDGVPYLYYK